jgi:hypothetical protein
MTLGGRRPAHSSIGRWAVLLAAAWSGVCTAELQNPSFEATYEIMGYSDPVPLIWQRVEHPSFALYSTADWSTDGDWSAALVGRIDSGVRPGDYQSLSQWVDLTGVTSIAFDVALTGSAGAFEHFEASLLIDDVVVWSADAEGSYYNQQVNVPDLPEDWWWWHVIEIRLTAVDTGASDETYGALWDNLRLLDEPPIISAVIDLDPGTLNPRSQGQWVTCYIELPADWDASWIDGATVTLDGIAAHTDNQGWATWYAQEGNITDRDGDGLPERMVKFPRAEVQSLVEPPETTVTIQGCLSDGSTLFAGEAVLRILETGPKKK